MGSDIIGVIQANADAQAFALVLDLVWFLQPLSDCIFQ